jgi:rhodanese-related sulfurtransferase
VSAAPELPPGWFLKPHLEVSPRETAMRLASGTPCVLIDCRTDAERAIASIAGARHVPMPATPEWIATLVEAREDGDPDPALAGPIVVHCHHGVRSMQVVGLLHAAGFADARSMAGGIDWWSVSVDPTLPRY